MTERSANQDQFNWDTATVYQIYPRSFMEVRDGPHRGEGTIKGITSKLDYLADLGVDAIWISPFYPSPMIDGGYDISDYTDVDPCFGNLDDFKELVGEAHVRSLKVMVDLVLNHTSNEHEWFKESLDPTSPKSDWYVWKDGIKKADGTVLPPNNWGSVFSMAQRDRYLEGEVELNEIGFTPPVSAWSWNEQRQQFYLRSFGANQPDLNWQNEEVQKAATDVMRFWIDQGVDGFRVDVASHFGKDPLFRDEEYNEKYHENERRESKDEPTQILDFPNPYDQLKVEHSAGHMPTLLPLLKKVSSVLDEYPDKELRIMYEAYLDPERLEQIAAVSPENSSTFNFTCHFIEWDAQVYKDYLETYHAHLHPQATPNQVRGNHDQTRVASPHDLGYWGARSLAVMNLTLPGNIYIYNGEEGAFKDVDVPEEKLVDTLGFRDDERTPMLWDESKNAGFSDADTPWLPIEPLYKFMNLELQKTLPGSTINLYKELLRLRKSSPALNQNTPFTSLETTNPNTLAYIRGRGSKEELITIVNFSDKKLVTAIDAPESENRGITLISSRREIRNVDIDLARVELSPNEAIVAILTR